MPRILGRVIELWRYPVKSLRGEQVGEARCGRQGFEWDRHWAVQGADGKLASGKSTQRFRRMPGLFSMASYVDAAGVGWVRFPFPARTFERTTRPRHAGSGRSLARK